MGCSLFRFENMKRVIITGGVACGKSTVTDALLNRVPGTEKFNADAVVHQCLTDPKVKSMVKDRFGDVIVGGSGEIDRSQLRGLVFSDAENRQWLENTLHPLVADEYHDHFKACAESSGTFLHVAEIPLYFESQARFAADCVVAVTARRETQITRIYERGLDRATAESMISAQMTNDEKTRRSDIVVWNDGSRLSLENQIDLLVSRFYQPG